MLSFFRKKSIEQNATMPTSSLAKDNGHSSKIGDSVKNLGYNNVDELKDTVYGKQAKFTFIFGNWRSTIPCFVTDILRTIKDPEKPATLEELNVVYEDGIFVQTPTGDNVQVVSIYRHCNLYKNICLTIHQSFVLFSFDRIF